MRILCAVIIGYIIGIFAVAAQAAEEPVTILRRSTERAVLSDCIRRGTCDLKLLLFVATDYRIGLSPKPEDQHYGTSLYATYETSSFVNLEEYAFVNFIRGCVYASYLDPETGDTRIRYDVAVRSFGEYVEFRFPDWIIDSVDTDPVYWSNDDQPRHYLYQWQQNIFPVPNRQMNLYGEAEQKPPKPRLFVTDYPSQAFMRLDGGAQNVSLELRTCLYRSSDIPRTARRDTTDFGPPIACFDWRSSYVYNHALKKFESPKEIAAACRGGRLTTIEDRREEFRKKDADSVQ